ncbi:hypothetical protein [Sicyoidochytrium minutum DNA virus]|nr:hypothetical protein [Sicyoidochytrium minutum DNA virus]
MSDLAIQQKCSIKDLPPEVWKEVLGYTKPRKYWFATIVTGSTDGAEVFPGVSTNTRCFEDINDVSKDIVEGGHLLKVIEDFPNDRNMSLYAVDTLAFRENKAFRLSLDKSHINYKYFMGEVERPDDYFTWEGYLNYTILPLKRMDWLEYFFWQVEKNYQQGAHVFVHELEVGEKS